MIAAIRVRFTPTPASQVWGNTEFANWLSPGIHNSLGHYWFQSSFTHADLNFQIFPPIVMDDPRLQLTPAEMADNARSRSALVNGVSAQITASFNPDWSRIDGMLIWFAQPTDLFGGGAFPVPLPLPEAGFWSVLFGSPRQEYKDLPVAVCDVDSPFDAICQELGHAYGLEHPLNQARDDYGDPYDAMAAQIYGGYTSGFQRAPDPSLPQGKVVDGIDQQATLGPYLSAAHLTVSPFAAPLKAAGMFIDVPASYATGASSFTLHALDNAIAHYPAQPRPIVAIIPPGVPGGDTYYLELRRAVGYDAGLRKNAADVARPPQGVVIHCYDAVRERMVWVDALPLANNNGDRDYHLFGGGNFTFRITSIGADYRSVGITIGGPDFWRNFGITIVEDLHEVLATTQSEWEKAEVSPCFMFGVGAYYHHYEYNHVRNTLVASTFGYEQPGYVWTLNDVALDPNVNSAKISALVESPGPGGKVTATRDVTIDYTVGPDRLSMSSDPAQGNFSLLVGARAVETSPSVLKNFYPDRSIETRVRFHNVTLVWDDNYKRRQKECKDAADAVNRKRIPLRKVGVPKPGDRLGGLRLEALIEEVIDVGRGVTSALVEEVVRVGNSVIGQINKRR